MSDTIAVIGLGYVGLPLAVAFGSRRRTIGFDIDEKRIQAYRAGHDPMGDLEPGAFGRATHLEFTADPAQLVEADCLIVAVPTPIDSVHQPDLAPLKNATATVGGHMKPGATVIFESTVYPGCTEEVCVPILEEKSGGKWRRDFFVGYSPERINPGDKKHRLDNVVKVVSGDTPETLERVATLYEEVVHAGVHRATSIKVAEAAKVIENTQRDLNIALVNELAIIFGRLGIDTQEVLEAAGTKWNFLNFRPGLVGGHCIGVDPYYLTYKAETLSYHPHVILAGRRINDGMGKYVAEQTIKQLIATGAGVKGANISLLGLTFKEDCPDIRNTRVVDIIAELRDFGVQVHVHDPHADPQDAQHEYGVTLTPWDELPPSQAVIVAVGHRYYRELGPERLLDKLDRPGCLMDVKSMFDPSAFAVEGVTLWRL